MCTHVFPNCPFYPIRKKTYNPSTNRSEYTQLSQHEPKRKTNVLDEFSVGLVGIVQTDKSCFILCKGCQGNKRDSVTCQNNGSWTFWSQAWKICAWQWKCYFNRMAGQCSGARSAPHLSNISSSPPASTMKEPTLLAVMACDPAVYWGLCDMGHKGHVETWIKEKKYQNPKSH